MQNGSFKGAAAAYDESIEESKAAASSEPNYFAELERQRQLQKEAQTKKFVCNICDESFHLKK